MGRAVEIKLLGDGDEREYERFLASAPGATIYHSLLFRDLLVAILNPAVEYALARRGGTIVGVLPLMGKSGSCGTVLNSLPFFGSYGDILAIDPEARKALISWFFNRLERGDVAAATLISNPFDPNAESNWSDTCESDERIAQWTSLPIGPDCNSALLGMIDGSARRNIGKAEKAGVSVHIDNSAFDFLEQTHRENMAAIGGTPKPPSFFTAIQRVMSQGKDYRIYVATHQNVQVGAILLFYFGEFVEYITPVTTTGCRDLQPTAALLYQAMIDAMGEGRSIWNWGGTWLRQDGVYRFKRKWGASEKRYSYATFLRNLALKSMTTEDISDQYTYFYAFPFKPVDVEKSG